MLLYIFGSRDSSGNRAFVQKLGIGGVSLSFSTKNCRAVVQLVRASDCLSECLRVRVPSVLPKYAPMVELADTLDLGSSGEIRAGSSPAGGTKVN